MVNGFTQHFRKFISVKIMAANELNGSMAICFKARLSSKVVSKDRWILPLEWAKNSNFNSTFQPCEPHLKSFHHLYIVAVICIGIRP
jgi:hypothetical protein